MTDELKQKSLAIADVTLECVVGDIAAQPDAEAVVNAANAELRIGGGVFHEAGTLHGTGDAAGGPSGR